MKRSLYGLRHPQWCKLYLRRYRWRKGIVQQSGTQRAFCGGMAVGDATNETIIVRDMSQDVLCFAAGTQIVTPEGERFVPARFADPAYVAGGHIQMIIDGGDKRCFPCAVI